MNIISIYAYQGRNIYSHRPVVKMDVDLGDYYDTPTCKIEGFNDKLTQLLPGLKKHACSTGYEGGFGDRLQEGTYLAHVLEHSALELQNTLGYSLSFGKARSTENERIYRVVYGYTNECAGLEAGKLLVDIFNRLIKNDDFREIKKDFDDRYKQIIKRCIETDFGSSTAVIKQEADKRGIPSLRIGDGSIIQLGYGFRQKRIQATLTENASCIAVDIACNKNLAKTIMHEYGIPVPMGMLVRSEKEALEAAEKIGYPVVVKPNSGNQGKGVSTNLKNLEEVKAAYKIATEYEDVAMVEQYVKGNYYRLLVVGEEVVAASQRISAHVVGNGMNTISELIELENKNPLRGEGHEKPLTKIKMDKVVEAYLKRQNLKLDYVPQKEEVIRLRENDNLSTGGIAIDVTDIVHEKNKEMAVLAAKAIGLDVAGIDITAEDISRPMEELNGAIIEINAAPGIRMHHYPAKGQPRNAAKAIVGLLFPEGSAYTIPIISITGTNGKTTTTRMVAHIVGQLGYRVGMTTTSGVYIDRKLVKKGDNTGPASAKTVLMEKTVEYAVLETARGGIVNRGLGYDLADVGIITNISEDHLGIDGVNTLEDLTQVKSLVLEAVKPEGYAVINADNEYCLSVVSRLKSKLIYFSEDPQNKYVVEHIKAGGTSVYLDGDVIFIARERTSIPLLSVKDIPATFNGQLRFNVLNSLAAVAGAIGLGIGEEDIRRGLSTFTSTKEDNPGRFNLFDVNGVRVVLDYGHNVDAYKTIIESLKAMKTSRLIGVIGVPGDRTDTSTFKIGQLCANAFDRIYIKEDKDRRGRTEGEVANILESGCKSILTNPTVVTVELCEQRALEMAINEAEQGDIIVVFYEEYKPLLDVIEKAKSTVVKQEEMVIA